MLKKIKAWAIIATSLVTLGAPLALPAMVHADLKTDLCTGVDTATSSNSTCAGSDAASSQGTITSLIKAVIKVFSIIVGAVSVLMIVYGGFKYITSGGDSGNVTAAKNTILYALIGLVVVALAQLIVRFVLGQATSITG